MRHIESPPGWTLRLKERSRQRRSGDRITRWIAVPARKPSSAIAFTIAATDESDRSSNDNLYFFPAQHALG